MFIIAIVLLIIILAVSGYYIYKYVKTTKLIGEKTKQFIPYIHDASIDKRFNYGSLPESSHGNEYNINFWIYVNDYVYRKDEDKSIIYKGDVIGTLNNADNQNNVNRRGNPGIWLLKNVNTLRVQIGLDTQYDENPCNSTVSVCDDSSLPSEICDIPNFPLQKWVAVNVSLRSNVLDIFLNGTLVKSCILSGSPMVSKGDMYVLKDGGFNGYISNLKYSNKALSAEKIYKMYSKGPTLK
jgi:hypothetical protein